MTENQERRAHYDAIKARRLAELRRISSVSRGMGLDHGDPIVLYYTCFGFLAEGQAGLAAALEDDGDEVTATPGSQDVLLVSGTPDRSALPFDREQIEQWVAYMCDLAEEFDFYLSSFTLTAVEQSQRWKSSDFAAEAAPQSVAGANRFFSEVEHQEAGKRNQDVIPQFLRRVAGAQGKQKLECFFETVTEVKAQDLSLELNGLGYDAIRKEKMSNGRFIVSALSGEIALSEVEMQNWVGELFKVAFQHDAVLDGWGLPRG